MPRKTNKVICAREMRAEIQLASSDVDELLHSDMQPWKAAIRISGRIHTNNLLRYELMGMAARGSRVAKQQYIYLTLLNFRLLAELKKLGYDEPLVRPEDWL